MNPSAPPNGLSSFAFHAQERPPAAALLRSSVARQSIRPAAEADAESIARMYVQQALASPDVPELAAAEVRGRRPEFKLIAVEKIPLAGTQAVKFRQTYRGIPVYGSHVVVELDENQELLAITSALGEPTVDPVASISAKAAAAVIGKAAGYPEDSPPDLDLQMNYYFAQDAQKWYLVWVAENVPKRRAPGTKPAKHALPEIFDYVVCAHTCNLVAELPRTMTAGREAVVHPPAGSAACPGGAPAPMALAPTVFSGTDIPLGWEAKTIQLKDELGRMRSITIITDGTAIQLFDPVLRIRTHNFLFQDIDLHRANLPGDFAATPPGPWAEGAICAHANASDVARYLREVLLRNGLDNLGGPIVSSICCCSIYNGGRGQAWHNAAWTGTQMVYGQRQAPGSTAWRSYARAADVVAHEFIHGVTDKTARLQYQNMTGALNESYSDIFGILISNYGQADRGRWNWQLGEDLDESGVPARDLSAPKKHGQPDHMDGYVTTDRDYGGVHINSGIHNKAFHNLAMAKDGAGFLIGDRDLAAVFYLALSVRLSHTSSFLDSRRAVLESSRSMFRRDPPALLERKLAAAAKAFEDVGIKDN